MTNKEALEIIELSEIEGNSHYEKVFSEMKSIIADKTDNFSDEKGLSKSKTDMSEIIKNEGISKKDYVEMFGGIKRSEIDATKFLAENLQEIMIAEAEAEAELELLNL